MAQKVFVTPSAQNYIPVIQSGSSQQFVAICKTASNFLTELKFSGGAEPNSTKKFKLKVSNVEFKKSFAAKPTLEIILRGILDKNECVTLIMSHEEWNTFKDNPTPNPQIIELEGEDLLTFDDVIGLILQYIKK